MSHLGLTSQDMAFGHDGNYIHIYLAYTCNVFLLEKRIEGAQLPVLHLSALPADPSWTIGTPFLVKHEFRAQLCRELWDFNEINSDLCRLSNHVFFIFLFAFFRIAYFTNKIY